MGAGEGGDEGVAGGGVAGGEDKGAVGGGVSSNRYRTGGGHLAFYSIILYTESNRWKLE